MTPTFEELYPDDHGSSNLLSNESEILANIRYHYDINDLDPTDAIYFESSYFQQLYDLGLEELVHYAHQLNIPLLYNSNPANFFKILRTVTYYIDAEVQRALLEYNIPNVHCREQDPDTGKIIDIISRDQIDPHRMVAIPEPDGIHGNCFDIITITDWLERAGYIDDLGAHQPVGEYKNPATNEVISEEVANQILRGRGADKAWWFAYRENFGKNIPYIPDHRQSCKYKKLYELTEIVGGTDIIDLLDNHQDVEHIINKAGMTEIIDRLGNVNHPFAEDGNSLLHYVIRYSNHNTMDKINQLLLSGADVNVQNNDTVTPLMLAVQREIEERPAGYIDIINLLIEHGARVDDQDTHGYTPLMMATEREGPDGIEIMNRLIAAGADLNIRNMYDYTALMIAMDMSLEEEEEEDLERARILLTAGAYPNITVNDLKSPLMTAIDAAYMDNFEPLLLLLDNGADPNMIIDNYTPLMFALLYDENQTIGILLHKGADPNISNDSGTTPLMMAVKQDNMEAMEMLIDFRADVNARNNDGETALIIATEEETLPAVDILIQAEADLYIKNNEGKTALIIAEPTGNLELLDMLREYALARNDQ